AVAGWLASIVVGGLKYGLIGYIVAGLLGSVVGGWLLNALKIGINLGHPLVNTIITSAIGAIVVILIARMIG
ncbi:MAG TPA: GlsB/YeaQ/YmgE family stress response membrane protein, partial [Hyphomicrobiaceae bacterium]|nr:GlsB/YeaQ/YmgE family stress response membrane protein [Hyphomicrobiaceae bacterium]